MNNNFIAAGGQGCVRSNVISLRIATKTIECRTAEDRRRANGEVNALQKLGHHTNIVFYHGHSWHGNTLSIDMELCGSSLRHYINGRQYVLDEKIQVSWCHDVLSALAHLKQKDVLHRDIKPENVLVTEAGPLMGTLKLCDFGISKINVTGAITQNSMMYTEGYLAPEVESADDFSHASDLYAAGVTFWEVIKRRSAREFKREKLKEGETEETEGPTLEILVYKCTDVVGHRISIEDALSFADKEKKNVVGKGQVDFGKLFPDKPPADSDKLSPPITTPQPVNSSNGSSQFMGASNSSINPQLHPGFLSAPSETNSSNTNQHSPRSTKTGNFLTKQRNKTFDLGEIHRANRNNKRPEAANTNMTSGHDGDAPSTEDNKWQRFSSGSGGIRLKYTDIENYCQGLQRNVRQKVIFSLFLTALSVYYGIETQSPYQPFVCAGVLAANHVWMSWLCTHHPVFHLWILAAEVHASVVLSIGAALFVGNVLLFGVFTLSLFLSLIFPPFLLIFFVCYIWFAISLGTQIIFLAALIVSSMFLYTSFWKHILRSTF